MLAYLKSLKTHHQILFSLLIGLAVVAFWRGAWGVMDVYIFPGNYELSSWVCLIAALIVLGGTHYITKELV